jgi:hypothetical protein
MVAAERRQVDERVKRIIELKNKVCAGNDKNFVVINQKGIDPPSLDLLARAGVMFSDGSELHTFKLQPFRFLRLFRMFLNGSIITANICC